MSRIRIKNFGPIKGGYQENNGWMDVKKVSVFIGNQGSGKSTVAKLISTMSWIEKALNRGDISIQKITTAMFLGFLKYQRINNYFSKEKTEIEYEGDSYSIRYTVNNQFPIIRKTESKSYIVPKIMYVPAERNFLGSVSDAFNIKGLPQTLFTFAEEFRQSQRGLNGNSIDLPINDYKFKYDIDNDTSLVIGKDYQLNLLEASSGLQSTVPLYLVTRYLSLELKDEKSINERINVNSIVRMNDEIAKVMMTVNLTPVEKSNQVNLIRNKYLNKCLINIVEEPELNLFPNSQRRILNSMLEYNNMYKGNKLIMTTHSPYIITYLSIAIQAGYLKNKITSEELLKKLNKIVPHTSTVQSSDVVIYQLDEINGTIARLPDFEGIPSDKNYLNKSLADGNQLFDSLLEIEQEL